MSSTSADGGRGYSLVLLEASKNYCLQKVGTSGEIVCLELCNSCRIVGHKKKKAVVMLPMDTFYVRNNINSIYFGEGLPASLVDIELST